MVVWQNWANFNYQEHRCFPKHASKGVLVTSTAAATSQPDRGDFPDMPQPFRGCADPRRPRLHGGCRGPSFCQRGGAQNFRRLQPAARTQSMGAYIPPRTRCRLRGAAWGGPPVSGGGPQQPGRVFDRQSGRGRKSPVPRARFTWAKTLLRSTNAVTGRERMAAGVQDLPTDALFLATIWSRAWSERSLLHALATRQRHACPSGTAMASMHALPLRPRLVCPGPGTGVTTVWRTKRTTCP